MNIPALHHTLAIPSLLYEGHSLSYRLSTTSAFVGGPFPQLPNLPLKVRNYYFIPSTSNAFELLRVGKNGIRNYRDSDRVAVEEGCGYFPEEHDGHFDSGKKLLDQLIDKETNDPHGLNSTRKLLLVAECDGVVHSALGVTLKRGGSFKIGPLIPISGEHKPYTIRLMQFVADTLLKNGARKFYFTCPETRSALMGFVKRHYQGIEEATLPDHYKRGMKHIIVGVLNPHIKVCLVTSLERSCVLESSADEGVLHEVGVCDIRDREFIVRLYRDIYAQWHDDVDDAFISGLFLAHGRGLQTNMDFQVKSTRFIVSKFGDERTGFSLIVPKRGGPTKIYPLIGTPMAQQALVSRAREIALSFGGHKLYTFAHVLDTTQREHLERLGFSARGQLKSPYKSGHDLIVYDNLFR